MKQVSIVQNFICTMDERLKVLEDSVISLSNTFPDSEFVINYNSETNLDKVHSIYKNNVKNLKFYNCLEPEWANVTLSLSNIVQTPYLMYLCEDMVVNSTKDKTVACVQEYIDNDFDYMLLCKLHKYLETQYIEGYCPYSFLHPEKSPGYKKLKEGYFYLGKDAPHKRLSLDALYKTEWWKERLSEFILKGHKCTHDIPIRDIRKPNFYEGYYDFYNGMYRFADLTCYIPDEVIILEIENVKQNNSQWRPDSDLLKTRETLKKK